MVQLGFWQEPAHCAAESQTSVSMLEHGVMLWLLSRLCLPPAPAPSSVLGEPPGVRGAPVGPSSSCSQVALISDGSEPSLKGGELISALI